MTAFQRRATFCAIAIVSLALPNIYPRFMSPNEYVRLYTARAIVESHSLHIDRYLGRPSPASVSDVAYFRGHFYADKAVGMSLAAIPGVVIARIIAPSASVLMQLFAARLFAVTIPALLALWFVLRRARSPIDGIVIAGLFLGSVIFPQALGLTGHLPMTIAICAAAVLLARDELPASRVAIAGLLPGAAILIDFTSGIAALGLLIVVAAKTKSIRKIVTFAICCAAIASVQLAVNAICFDGPLDFAYHHEFNPADQANRAGTLFGIGVPHLDATWGLTVGRMQGIFVHSPFLLFAIPGAWLALRRKRDAIRIWAIAVCLAYFYLNCTLPDWEGGWALGPRYLTLIYPLLAWFVIDGGVKPAATPLLIVAVTWSVLLHMAAMLTWSMPPHWRFLSFPDLELSAYLLFRGVFGPNLLVWIGVPAAIAAILLVALALSAIVVNSGKANVAYVVVGALVFAIALSAVAPPDGSFVAEAYKPIFAFMGR